MSTAERTAKPAPTCRPGLISPTRTSTPSGCRRGTGRTAPHRADLVNEQPIVPAGSTTAASGGVQAQGRQRSLAAQRRLLQLQNTPCPATKRHRQEQLETGKVVLLNMTPRSTPAAQDHLSRLHPASSRAAARGLEDEPAHRRDGAAKAPATSSSSGLELPLQQSRAARVPQKTA